MRRELMRCLILSVLLLTLCGCEVKVNDGGGAPHTDVHVVKPPDVNVVKPPDVNVVKPPDVNVKAPDVNVNVKPPDVNVTPSAPNVNVEVNPKK
jgi:hypothetical protein